MNDSLEHIGKLFRSGRYPWGSGGRPYQRYEPSDDAKHVAQLISKNFKELSNQEMDIVLNRIRKEAQYLEATKKKNSFLKEAFLIFGSLTASNIIKMVLDRNKIPKDKLTASQLTRMQIGMIVAGLLEEIGRSKLNAKIRG